MANMGHSNHEIDVEGLKGLKRERIRRNVTTYQWPNGKKIFLLAEVYSMAVKPLNKGHLGNSEFVLYSEVSLILRQLH